MVRRFFEIAKTCCGASGELRAAKTEKLSKTTRYELHLDADALVGPLELSDPESLFGIRQTPVLENPCTRCRSANPRTCENKSCKRWQAWFLMRWKLIHGYYEAYGKEQGDELEK